MSIFRATLQQKYSTSPKIFYSRQSAFISFQYLTTTRRSFEIFIFISSCVRMTQVRSIWAAYKIGFKTGCNTKVLKIVNILFMHDDLYFRELNAVFPFLLLSGYCVNFIVKYPLKIYKTVLCAQKICILVCKKFFSKGKMLKFLGDYWIKLIWLWSVPTD